MGKQQQGIKVHLTIEDYLKDLYAGMAQHWLGIALINERLKMTDISYTLKSSVQINAHPIVDIAIDVTAAPQLVGVRLKQNIIYTDDAIIPYPEVEPREYIVGWSELDDMEVLANIFRAERVDVFQSIVTMLGNLHRNRAHVESMMATA